MRVVTVPPDTSCSVEVKPTRVQGGAARSAGSVAVQGVGDRRNCDNVELAQPRGSSTIQTIQNRSCWGKGGVGSVKVGVGRCCDPRAMPCGGSERFALRR